MTTIEDAASNDDGSKSTPRWEIIAASVIGGSFLTVADLLYSEQMSVTTKIAKFVADRYPEGINYVIIETTAFLFLIALGLGLCFVFRPKTRPAAFVRGSSVIGVLVCMNIGTQAIEAAKAGEITVQGSVYVSTDTPRAFGPFGVGTLLTGDAVTNATQVTLNGEVSLDCIEEIKVGAHDYCGIKSETAPAEITATGQATDGLIWVEKTAGN